MNIAASKGERTLSELTRRLFNIKGPQAAKMAKQAEAALLHVNPHLHDLTQVPEGTPIVVPDVPGVSPVATGGMGAVSAEITAQLQQALADAGTIISQSLANEEREANEIATLAKSRALRELTKQQPDLIPRTVAESKARLQSVETLTKSHTQGLAELEQALSKLLK
jgi:hypothetical protein